jgi:hypothetical protein
MALLLPTTLGGRLAGGVVVPDSGDVEAMRSIQRRRDLVRPGASLDQLSVFRTGRDTLGIAFS